MAIASFVLSLLSILFTGYISWDRWHDDKKPAVRIDYEDYDMLPPDSPYLEITNVGNADLKRVEIELRGTLVGYIPVVLAIFENEVNATGLTKKLDIGSLDALETKRLRIQRNRLPAPNGSDGGYYPPGTADLYVHCRGRFGSKWRIPVSVRIEASNPSDNGQ